MWCRSKGAAFCVNAGQKILLAMIEEIRVSGLTNNAGLDSLICSGNCKFADKQITNKLCHNTVWKIKNSLHSGTATAQQWIDSPLYDAETKKGRKGYD